MYIKKITIRNFRNFSNCSFAFQKGVNTIVGENGVGKTNLFEAMRLLLDESISGKERRLQGEDFSRSIGKWQGHWVSVQAFFEEIGDSEVEKVLAYATSDLEEVSQGSYTYLFRPRKEVRKKLFELSILGNSEAIEELLTGLTVADYEYRLICRSSVDLSDDDSYLEYVGDFENNIFPDPDDKTYDDIWGNGNSNFAIFDHTSFTYIKALRDAVRELKYAKGSPLKYLFEALNSEVDQDELEEIVASVEELNENIGSLEPIADFTSDLVQTLESSVGFSYSPKIQVKSEVPSELGSLLRSLALWVGDPNDDHLGYLDDLSLGGANLVYLSVKLLEYQRKKSKDKIIHFLVVEEPEAHIHTHIQKSLFANLDADVAQVFVSTHSTHLSSVANISRMNILSSLRNKSEVFQPSAGLPDPVIKKIERYLDAVRSNLLFSKGVVLVEGDAEEILIPQLFRKCLGLSLDELGVSIVNIGSTGFDNIALLFHDERIKRRCAIITDSDVSILKTAGDNQALFEKLKRSEESGKVRLEALQDNYGDNDWIRVFSAGNTFEVDLIKSGNKEYFKKLAESMYSKGIAKIKEELESADVSIAGLRALKMATATGKGWFAIELAGAIDADFRIPDYILSAVAFACSQVDQDKLVDKAVRYLMPDVEGDTTAERFESYQEYYGEDDNLVEFVEELKGEA